MYILPLWREEISDEQWARLEPLLPPLMGWGRPYLAHRLIVSGIIWVLRTGAPWRDVPERFGKWTTVSSRYSRWTAQGVWQAIWASLQREGDRNGQLNWSMHFVDQEFPRPLEACATRHHEGAEEEKRRSARRFPRCVLEGVFSRDLRFSAGTARNRASGD
ncbi:hypothetical protein GCM10008959_23240 [Deinococcus seoulensis]|uniref:Insertion element IS402-like domain-containing protein n=1 Tax=Deinococcus seoulensis TaxID=1837379 RepID=A0ABQ2RUE4_9DEIO|nr:transposase [Deinococcus seoulensis]GGR60792.1 hypothetical protein GCM10008959_23240 [Deinococcus seoulensis]